MKIGIDNYEERCGIAVRCLPESPFRDQLERLLDEPREYIAQWMIRNGLATGHGDTIGDLLDELLVQIHELKLTRPKKDGGAAGSEKAHEIYQQLFDLLHQEHGITPTITEMQNIEGEVLRMQQPMAVVKHRDRHPLNLEFIGPVPPVGSELCVCGRKNEPN